MDSPDSNSDFDNYAIQFRVSIFLSIVLKAHIILQVDIKACVCNILYADKDIAHKNNTFIK